MWSIVADGEVSLLSNGFISHADSRVDWEVVCSDILMGLLQFSRKVPSWSVVKNSLLHFQTVGVGVESLLVVEVLDSELSIDFISSQLVSRNTVEVHIKLERFGVFVHNHTHEHSLV